MNQFDVRVAGAKGDSTSDDTVVFQKMIDLAAKCEGTVIVPPGHYRVGQLKVHSNVGIVGHPSYSWKGAAGSVLELNDPNATCLLDLTLAIGARISGICLDGRGLGKGIHGILVDKDDFGETEDSPLIEGSKVTKFSGDGVHLNRIWCFRIRGSMLSENDGNGLSVQGYDGFILDNWISFNKGSGYASIGDGENNAVTITGNRIEWNREGGICILNGSRYNITGNYIDRCGPGIRFERTHGAASDPNSIIERTGYSTITGNVIYRSGRPEWSCGREWASAHLVLRGVQGVAVTGNTMVVGRDDTNNEGSFGYSAEPNWSPEYGMILEKLSNVIIKDNTLDSGATKTLIRDGKNHRSGVIIRDNVGDLFGSPLT